MFFTYQIRLLFDNKNSLIKLIECRLHNYNSDFPLLKMQGVGTVFQQSTNREVFYT
jgi:hypothetical protein